MIKINVFLMSFKPGYTGKTYEVPTNSSTGEIKSALKLDYDYHGLKYKIIIATSKFRRDNAFIFKININCDDVSIYRQNIQLDNYLIGENYSIYDEFNNFLQSNSERGPSIFKRNLINSSTDVPYINPDIGPNIITIRDMETFFGINIPENLFSISYVYSVVNGGKKSPVKKSTLKKSTLKKSTVKKSTVKKSTVKKAPVKKAPVKKAPVKKAPVKKRTIKKSLIKKSTVKKRTVKKSPVKK